MRRQDTGPRRSQSIDAYQGRTRVIAVVALLVLAGAIISDVFGGTFWARHALLASLVASVIVVMLTVAVINEVLERRTRERWRVLAQYVMLELVRNARLIWTSVLQHAGLLAPDATRPDAVEDNARLVRDTPCLTAAVRVMVADDLRLQGLRDEIALLVAHTDDVLGRWAAVMLNADVYADVIDRHVELATAISWLASLLDNADPPEDHRRKRRARSSPTVQVEGDIAGDPLADRITVITQLAEELDRTTLELALRIVPLEWWRARLDAPLPARSPGRRSVGDVGATDEQVPDVIDRYFAAHDRRDTETALASFSFDGRVRDDGHDYVGHDEIRDWLRRATTRFTYTRTGTAASRITDEEWEIGNRLEGNFPGGVVDLRYRVRIDGDLIGELVIEP